ncbi:response regulator transcription factor [Hymenobacter sp. 15J16-1T3B]|uniref:helix-turn-helix transcriptional regulator n=1 Tax=Hymenobacter sp. 15J16-1T3B TaxID=2886941 RepID=UPI001D12EF52|nr:response regulator transcription factor [Hymenobacter sp. 15J16-1T3B]MCC3156299.1 response regulator transcription factor [Hymenobacter sp. 15J16-1T3B]
MPSLASVTAAPVLVVAPPTLYRQGLLSTLQEAWPLLELILNPDADQLPALVHRQPFALVVLDSSAAGHALPQLIARMRTFRPQQPVLALTAQRLSARSQQELRHHATTLLPRHSSPQQLVQAMQPWLSRTSGGHLPAPSAGVRHAGPPTPFSRRELDVLRLVVGDCNNREIAEQLCLSVRTVESHRRALLQKTGARSLIGLVVQAVREGWVVS